MSNFIERLLSMVHRETERTMRKYHKPPRLGLVSSYDKVNHAVKVKFQPEGTESGWIPLTAHAVGNQWGILSAPNNNDQVLVEFEGGDHMVARVGMRHFSTQNKPPQIDPGEHQFTHSSGSTIYFKKDGTVLIGGGQTMQTGQYASGQSGDISTGQSTGETGQSQPQQQNNPPNAKQTITLKPDGTLQIDVPNNDFNTTVDNNNHNITAGGSITHTSSGTATLQSSGSDVNVIAGGKIVHHSPTTISLDSPVTLYEGVIIVGDLDPNHSGGGSSSLPSGSIQSNNFNGPHATGLG